MIKQLASMKMDAKQIAKAANVTEEEVKKRFWMKKNRECIIKCGDLKKSLCLTNPKLEDFDTQA